MESESSAKAGSSDSRGQAAEPDFGVKVWLSRREVRELGRRGVDGREGGLVRLAEVERLGFGNSILTAKVRWVNGRQRVQCGLCDDSWEL